MKASTSQIENPKKFDEEIALILSIEFLNGTNIQFEKSPKTNATLTKNGTKLSLNLSTRLLPDDDDKISGFPIKINDSDYTILHGEFKASSTKVQVGIGIKQSTTYSIHTLQSVGFEIQSIFRSFFPVDLENMKPFHEKFETVTHPKNGIQYQYDCIRIEIDNKQFDIIQFKTEEQGFYVIESFSEEQLEAFREYNFIIRQAIGFISGFMVGGEEYIFTDKKEMYYSNYMRPSIKAMYSPILTNPYSIPDIDGNTLEKYINALTKVPSKVLSNLAVKIKDSQGLSASVILLLESTSIRSLLVIPSIFSVIIESLSKLIVVAESGLEYPITNPGIKDRIFRELITVVDSHVTELSDNSILKLKRRILAINNPINRSRLTNNEKLTQPFEQLEIPLTLHDISIIEHRNDLLHGNILLKKEEGAIENDTDTYMAYVSAKLYTLISKLILKYVGYNGYVYNQAKHLEKYLLITTDEEYLEMI